MLGKRHPSPQVPPNSGFPERQPPEKEQKCQLHVPRLVGSDLRQPSMPVLRPAGFAGGWSK